MNTIQAVLPFRIGVSSWTWSWAVGVPGYPQPAEPADCFSLLNRAIGLGADTLQIADNLPLDKLNTANLDRLGREAEAAGIRLEVGTAGLDPANLLCYLEIAAQLGAPLVRTLPHYGLDRPDLSEALRRLEQVLPELERAGIQLGIENHDYYPARWLSDLVTAAAADCLGVCLDPVNNLGQGESEAEVFTILSPHTINFHCKDYRIDRKPSKLGFDVTGASTGRGFLDLQRASGLLVSGISWVIELWTAWQGDIQSTVGLEQQWARESVTFLKDFRRSLN